MPSFEYTARTKQGDVQTGQVEAIDKNSALQILQHHELVVISLESSEEESIYFRRIKFFEHVNKKEIAIFSRQLSTLFAASVPLVVSLHTLANQIENPKFQEALLNIAANVDGGMQFSSAILEYEDIFSNFYIQMIRAGEESGTLDEVLQYLAEYSEREYHVSSKIKGAMTYPAFVFSVFIFVGIAMLVFVVPSLLNVLSQSGEELPFATKAIVFLSDNLRERWYVILTGVILFGVGIWRFLKLPIGKDYWSRVQLHLPIFGNLFRKIYLFRFAESLGMLIRGGVPINTSLEITANVIDNLVYKRILLEAKDKVNKGEGIAETLAEYPEIAGMVTQMIAVGEKTGKLDVILQNISKFYEKEVDAVVDNLVALIEPIMIVSMGLGVALLMAGVLLPVYSTINTIQ